MGSQVIYPQGRATIVLTAGQSIAVASPGKANVFQQVGVTTPNYPPQLNPIGSINYGQTVFGPYAGGATIVVDAGAAGAQVAVGVSPMADWVMQTKVQPAPGVLNATGTLTAAMISAGAVTSTTAAAVAATLDTGANMDLALANMAVNDAFDWTAINTGGANAFTVTASAGHTIVGSGTVALSTSGYFRTRKTAAGTYVTYRLS